MSKLSNGVAHNVPEDLKKVLNSSKTVIAKWENLTPLSRNEWICWVISVKKAETRKEHISRVQKQLIEGKRRPCCWAGCIHRKDKSLSPSQKYVIGKQKSKKS